WRRRRCRSLPGPPQLFIVDADGNACIAHLADVLDGDSFGGARVPTADRFEQVDVFTQRLIRPARVRQGVRLEALHDLVHLVDRALQRPVAGDAPDLKVKLLTQGDFAGFIAGA